MTTNSPNPVDGDVQALIYRCKDAVAHLSQMVEAGIRGGRYSVTEYRYQLMINKIALAALEAEPVAWVVMAPQGDYIERNPEVVAHLEGTGLAKCKPLYDDPPAQLFRPVELPFKRDLRDERENGFLERAIGWNECIDEVQRLNATAQPVSDQEWTNEQCLEFLTIAFRHVDISGDIEMDDIRLGIRMVNAAAPGGQDV